MCRSLTTYSATQSKAGWRLILGDDEGTAEIAAEYGIRHQPDIPYHENRLPFVGPLFALAQETATFDLMMYINSDIILISDFVSTLRKIVEYYKNRTRPFLAVGRRTDLKLTERLDFNDPGWEISLRADAKQHGRENKAHTIDYFIFKKGPWPGKIPAFTIGANYLDNYLIGAAFARGMDVIDTTEGITAIQQEYYNRQDNAFVFKRSQSPEAERVRNLYFQGFYIIPDNPYLFLFKVSRANLKYTSNNIRKRPFELYDIIFFIGILGPTKYPRLRPIFKTVWRTYNNRMQRHNPIIRRLLRWAGWGYL